MKFAVYPETDVARLPGGTSALHLARPVSAKKLAAIFEKRDIGSVSCSESTARRLKPKLLALLQARGISLGIEKRAGKPLQLDLKKMRAILEMVHDHRSMREIEKALGVPKSTVHYLIRYADRGKIKNGNRTVYLK